MHNHRNLASHVLDEESSTACIDAPDQYAPLYHPIDDLERRALLELRPIAEAWVNHDEREKKVHLVGNNAYGLRIYQNQSRLNMHIDKKESHIISAILHVDHDANSKPWVSYRNEASLPSSFFIIFVVFHLLIQLL